MGGVLIKTISLPYLDRYDAEAEEHADQTAAKTHCSAALHDNRPEIHIAYQVHPFKMNYKKGQAGKTVSIYQRLRFNRMDSECCMCNIAFNHLWGGGGGGGVSSPTRILTKNQHQSNFP